MLHGTIFNATWLRESIHVTWQSIYCNNVVRIWSLFKVVQQVAATNLFCQKSSADAMLHISIFYATMLHWKLLLKIVLCNITFWQALSTNDIQFGWFCCVYYFAINMATVVIAFVPVHTLLLRLNFLIFDTSLAVYMGATSLLITWTLLARRIVLGFKRGIQKLATSITITISWLRKYFLPKNTVRIKYAGDQPESSGCKPPSFGR